jgi:hypothetical protein
MRGGLVVITAERSWILRFEIFANSVLMLKLISPVCNSARINEHTKKLIKYFKINKMVFVQIGYFEVTKDCHPSETSAQKPLWA